MTTACAACEKPVPTGARFCPACGGPMDDRPRCACGEPLVDGARFCSACGRATAAAPPEPQAERRPVTVLFADAVGSTAFAERAGDEAAYRFVQDSVALMTATIERHGGTITQFRGDGVMALFGAPVAHEDSAVRATTAAIELRDALSARMATAGCSFRIGLSTGPVVVGRVGDDVLMDYTAIGDTANVAARMEAAAEPGTVYLSETTWRAVRQYVECRPVGELEVKGKSAPIAAHKALRRRPIRTRLEAAVERGLGPFVGRGRELDLLLGHVDALGSGRGHVVELTGEAGIGKSRLLLELRRRIPDTVGWVEGHCSASAGDTPYLPIADLLRNAFGIEENDDPATITERVETATTSWTSEAKAAVPFLKYLLDVDPDDESVLADDPRTRRAAIVDALRLAVADAGRRQPRVLVIEDIHWADAASLDALDALADIAESEPILLLTTSRPGRTSPFDRRSTHSRVALDGISDEAATAMAAGVLDVEEVPPDVAALITGRADGNPLFVEELTATLLETGLVVRADDELRLLRPAESIDVPGTLHEVILARIDRLAREARDALQLAAVIGREFTVRLLDRLAGLPEGLDGALDELKAVELIRQKAWFPELAYLFKHAITHEVTYSTLLDERRRDLHRLVAQAIEDVYGDRIAEHVETLAHHWSVAEEWPKALDYLEQAADRAAATFSNDAALSYYDQAIAIAERLDEPARAVALFQRKGDVLMGTGALADAAALFERMATTARAVDDPEALAWALAYRGECLAYLHDWQGGETCLIAAVATDGASTNPRLYAGALLKLVRVIFGFHDRSAEFDPVIEELRSNPVDNPRTIVGLVCIEAPASRWQGDLQTCLQALTPDPPPTSDLLATQSVYWMRGLVQVDAGRFEEGLATLTSAYERSVRCGETFIRARLYNSIGWARLEVGDHAGAIEWNERCVSYLREIDLPDEEMESNARNNLAEAFLSLGQLDRAAIELERVEDITRGQPLRGTWLLWRFTQRRLLLQSRLQLALGRLRPDSRIDDCMALAEESNSAKYLVKAARLRSDWALAARALDEAEVEAARALDLATSYGHPQERWRSLALLADIADARGDAELAHEHRASADALLADVERTLTDPAARAGVVTLRAALR